MREAIRRTVAVALFACLCTLPVTAAGFTAPTDQDLVLRSDAIIHGHVISHYSFRGDDGKIRTRWNILVSETFRGDLRPGDFARVVEKGGMIDGRGVMTTAAARFEPHQEVVLFLQRRAGGGWQTFLGPWGKFAFQDAADGTRWLVRDSFGGLVTPGSPDRATGYRHADAFLEFLRTGIAKRSATSAAGVVAGPSPTDTLPADYLLHYCDNSDVCHAVRWPNFDMGSSIVMATNGTQTGFSDSLGAVDRAMGAWNGDVGSNVNYIRSGTSTALISDMNPDGQNVVVLDSQQVFDEGYAVITWFWWDGTHQRFSDTFWSLDEVDVGITKELTASSSVLDELLTWGLGVGLGFDFYDDGYNPLGASATTSVMFGAIDGTFGASIGSFDRMALAAVYPSGVLLTPTIRSFTASPTTIRSGQSSTLLWYVENASLVEIAPSIGPVSPNGTMNVMPTSDTTYTLTAENPSGTSTATVTIDVLTSPEVIVSGLPKALVQDSGVGGATSSFSLRNIGGASTNITLSESSSFFHLSPSSFSLGAGASQTVSVIGDAVSSGSYRGDVTVSGSGVASGTKVRVSMLVTTPPSGPTSANAPKARVDVNGQVGSNPTGSVQFTNTGDNTIQGTLASDVPWIIPQSGIVTIAPGETVTVTFTIDRSLLPEGDDIGSRSGSIQLVFRTTTASKGGAHPSATSTLVTPVLIVDTSTPSVGSSALPPIPFGQVAYFVPGVGHTGGANGLYISDVSFTNLTPSLLGNRLDMYYTSLAGSTPLNSGVNQLKAQQPLAFGDVVKNVFNQTGSVGTIQLRSSSLNKIAANANILNVSDPSGTFGTTIPVLRSDRSVGPGGSLYLTDIRTSSTSHTNYYIQETAGGSVDVTVSYLNSTGVVLGTHSETVDGFQIKSVTDLGTSRLPAGTVTMRFSSSAESTGQFSAYATPVDDLSRDFWAVVDWNRQLGLTGSEPMLIPNVGTLRGANQTFFRTDAAFFNNGTSQASVKVDYHYTDLSNGQKGVNTANITLNSMQSRIVEDVVTSLVPVAHNNLGYIVVTPTSGTINVTSRTFATVGGKDGTFGTGVTTLPASSGAKLGDVIRIGGVDDSSVDSVNGKVPGSFRTNFFLLEASGTDSVTAKVTIYFPVASSGLAQATAFASKEYTLAPGELKLVQGITNDILGSAARSELGDLHNIQVEFAVTSGDGSLTAFVTSVDNGSADTILRTE